MISRLGLKWDRWALILGLILLFWTWLFLDFDPDQNGGLPHRGATLMQMVRPEGFVEQWFGNVGNGTPPSGLADRGPIMLAAGLILLASFGPGALVVNALIRRGSLDRLEQTVLAIGGGLNLASLYVLGGGMLAPGALHETWWIWLGLLGGLLLLPVAIWLVFLRANIAQPSAESEAPQQPAVTRPAFSFERFGGWLIGILCIPYLLGGVLPPWDFDVREYHLQAPKEWLQRGQIDFLPHNVYANMPLGAELHAITATTILGGGEESWWLGGLTGKLLISLFAPLTALLLWCIGRRSGQTAAGFVAAVVYLSLPWVAHVSLSGLNDAVLGFYLLAAWWVWLRSEAGDWRALILAGFFGGAAAAVKYPALLFGILPMYVETWLRRVGLRGAAAGANAAEVSQTSTSVVTGMYVGTRRVAAAVFALLLLTLGLASGGGLWYAKNAVQTGNPFYPLLVAGFGGETRTAEKDARWVQAHSVPRDKAGRRFTISQFIAGVTDLAFRNRWASPLLIPLALLGGIFAIHKWWSRQLPDVFSRFPVLAIGLFTFIFAAWFLMTHRLDRFLVPALPLLALLAGLGYVFAKERTGPTIARIFLLAGLAYCWVNIAGTFLVADVRWFVALQHLRNDAGEGSEEVPALQRLRPAERWLNANLANDEGVLLVGGAAVWDLKGPTKATNVYYNTCFDNCVLLDWWAGKKTVKDLRAEFESRQVKYVCVDWSELARYWSDGNYGYDRRFTPQNSLDLIKNLEKFRLLKHEIQFGSMEKSAFSSVFTVDKNRPQQVIYRVLTAEEAVAAAAAEKARRKAATQNIKPTPKAAPPASANQSRKSQ